MPRVEELLADTPAPSPDDITEAFWQACHVNAAIDTSQRPRPADDPVTTLPVVKSGSSRNVTPGGWTSHRDRHQEGLALTECKDLTSATIIRFTTPAAARSWLYGL
jgi:hypothetical protein